MRETPAWKAGVGRVYAAERRQEREDIAADVQALGCMGKYWNVEACVDLSKSAGVDHDEMCPIAIAAMIRAGGKKP